MIDQAIKIAVQEAEKSDCRYRLGAVAVLDNTIVAKGYNRYDIHPFLKRKYGYYSLHAEAITILRSHYYKATTLVVVRITKNKNLTCSFPCKKCQAIAKDFNFKKIVYIDWSGKPQEIKI